MEISEKYINDNYIIFAYINSLDDHLKEIIDNYFLEIVKGKIRIETDTEGNKEKERKLFNECCKYITSKTLPTAKLGIIGELVFHLIMRTAFNSEFVSALPTIGIADSYKQFYKGFDGVYLKDNRCWISEVKSADSKSKINENKDLNKIAKEKIMLASNTIESEVGDKVINRWHKAKDSVLNQHTLKSIHELSIFELVDDSKYDNYNKIPVTMIVNNDEEFNLESLMSYIEDLKDKKVNNQKILVICIRNKDLSLIYNYLKSKSEGK